MEYLVHLCLKNGDCQDVWIKADIDEDPEGLALDQYPQADAVRLVFDADKPVTRGDK